jgi:hypothetical protein
MKQISGAYKLVTANHRHNAERLDAVLLRIERRARAIIPEHNVCVHFGVQVRDPDVVVEDGVFETRLRLSVAAAAAAAVFAGAALLAVAVDVHVYELLADAVQVDDAGWGVFAVAECWSCR